MKGRLHVVALLLVCVRLHTCKRQWYSCPIHVLQSNESPGRAPPARARASMKVASRASMKDGAMTARSEAKSVLSYMAEDDRQRIAAWISDAPPAGMAKGEHTELSCRSLQVLLRARKRDLLPEELSASFRCYL